MRSSIAEDATEAGRVGLARGGVRSKPPPEPDLKAEIIAVLRHIAERTLFVLGDERKAVGDPVFECNDLVLVLR